MQNTEEKYVFIYSLNCPISRTVKYIGKTGRTLEQRLKEHLKDKRNNKRTCWIKSLRKKNLIPIIEIVDRVLKTEWIFWEQHYISLYRSWGFELKNSTNGGENIEMTPETRAKISESKKGDKNPMFGKIHPNRGTKRSEETCKRIGDSGKGRKMKDEQKKYLSSLYKNIPLSEEHKIKIGKGNRGKKRTIEERKKLSDIQKEIIKRTNKIPWNKGLKGIKNKQQLLN